MIIRLLSAAAVAALMSGAAMAQTAPSTMDQAPAAPAASTSTAASQPQAAPASPPVAPNPAAPPAAINDPSTLSPNPAVAPSAASTGTDTAGVIPMSSQTPEAQALLKAGDANVVTNGPVADTPENRAKYGKPMSNAGKRSAPKGN